MCEQLICFILKVICEALFVRFFQKIKKEKILNPKPQPLYCPGQYTFVALPPTTELHPFLRCLLPEFRHPNSSKPPSKWPSVAIGSTAIDSTTISYPFTEIYLWVL